MAFIDDPRRRAAAFCDRFGIRVPILLAPMAGACPPSSSIAVMRAGGFGACEQRRCRSRDDPGQKFPPPHSITSSAIASRVVGIWSPRTFAAFRLITSRNFVGF